MIAATSTLVALALAWCFAEVGDLMMRRRANGLVERNQSFLVGLSVTAFAFVFLSVLFSSKALALTLICLLVAGLLGMRRGHGTPNVRSGDFHADIWSLGFLLLIVLLFVQFSLQNIRLSYLWDGYQIWATKALVLYQHGALGKQWVAQGEQERLVSYPHIVPLYEALIPKVQGGFDWEALKAPFGFFYLSLLVSTFHAARFLVSQRVALAVTSLLALLPAVSTRSGVGGYADMPQAAFVAASVAALLENRPPDGTGWRSAAPWLIGGLVLVKSEGALLAAIACATIVMCWLVAAPAGVLSTVRRQRGAIAVVSGCFAIRWLSVVCLRSQDHTYGPLDRAHMARAYEHLLDVPRMCIQQMLNVSEWGVFWPSFLIAVIAVFCTGAWRERAVAGGTTVALAAYMSIFYFTNWDVSLHISQAFSRLLVQLAPSAVLIIGVAYSRLRGSVS